jgi:hypothetical protein
VAWKSNNSIKRPSSGDIVPGIDFTNEFPVVRECSRAQEFKSISQHRHWERELAS